MIAPLVEVKNVHKRFSGVYALNDVSLSIAPGEIRCLAGENGSGKSSLIKNIAGVTQPDEGQIILNGQLYENLSPIDAIHEGIQVIYQDFSLFPNLTVAENLAINSHLEQGRKLVSWADMERTAQSALAHIKVDIPLRSKVGSLSVANKQLVAIARALLHNAKLVIMDEPTTALTHNEVDSLFGVISELKSEDIATLFVSHKLREVLDISEKLTILRNGRKVSEGETSEYDEASITYHMTGHRISGERFTFSAVENEIPLLSVDKLGREGAFENVSLKLFPGEIIGITGLLGSGRTEVALSLFGILPASSGKMMIDGKEVLIDSVDAAIRAGIAYVPEDRLAEGLFLERSIGDNIIATILDRIKSSTGFIDFKKAASIIKTWIDTLRIATPSSENSAQSLSGGNQQRVVLAKWLAADSRIFILNGPTVGVDVGSKLEIHARLRKLASNGAGIVIMSDDMPEVVQNCNRVFVMHKGRIIREFKDDFDEDELISQIESLK